MINQGAGEAELRREIRAHHRDHRGIPKRWATTGGEWKQFLVRPPKYFVRFDRAPAAA
jgi:hypothetical protein